MTITPLFDIDGKEYSLSELDDLITAYARSQKKHNEDNSIAWESGYTAGLQDAEFLIKQHIAKRIK